MTPQTPDAVRDAQTYTLIGVGLEVHRLLGPGFLEPVYQEAYAVELSLRGLPYQREVALPIRYKERLLRLRYQADFLCFGEVLIELKALDRLTGREEAQLINYLVASGLRRGLLLNFGAPSLQFKRFVHSQRANE